VERGGGGDAAEERWRKRRSATAGEAALRRRSASRLAAEGEEDMGGCRPAEGAAQRGLNRADVAGRWGARQGQRSGPL
jgi:hypothetical protein